MSLMATVGTILAAAAGEPFNAGDKILGHVVPADAWFPYWWSPSKSVLWMAFAALLVVLLVTRAVKGYDSDGVPRTRIAQMVDPFVEHFYRDVALHYVGAKYAKAVTPLALCFFFFILVNNLLGLVPLSDVMGVAMSMAMDEHALHSNWFFLNIVEGSSTATGNFNVTVALASITFVAIIVFGIKKHGFVGHFAHLAGPKDAPAAVRYLLLVPIETISMFVKPFALTMRLAANMTAGHMGLLALLLMPAILSSLGMAGGVAAGAGVPVVLLATGIMLLEIIVCFVQAYVFSLLSTVFIGMAIHTH